jgi:NADPH:quinone reductase-like Zn-dependent oxidoreductase
MKAILVTAPGPASNFYIGDVPIPQPKDNEVLIRITHSALNRADLMQVKNTYHLRFLIENGRLPCPSWSFIDHWTGMHGLYNQ